jgi:hypothetical protein
MALDFEINYLYNLYNILELPHFMFNISELYLFVPAWCLHTRWPCLIFLTKMSFFILSMYEVIVFNLNQQEVYFHLFSTIVNYVQKMELVKTVCL